LGWYIYTTQNIVSGADVSSQATLSCNS
jgi:hypothetical protein